MVTPTPEVLLLEPFKKVWEEDQSERKELAIAKFAYVEYMCSHKKTNPFRDYLDTAEREAAIFSFLKRNSELVDDDVRACMEVYKSWLENNIISIKFYKSAKMAAEKLSDFFTNFNLDATNERTGNPLYKPADITRALKETNDILKTLNSLEENVQQELYDTGKGKAGREINIFER